MRIERGSLGRGLCGRYNMDFDAVSNWYDGYRLMIYMDMDFDGLRMDIVQMLGGE